MEKGTDEEKDKSLVFIAKGPYLLADIERIEVHARLVQVFEYESYGHCTKI